MAPTHRSGLTKNIKDCEALLETLYRERDARIERQMQPPQVAQQVTKIKRAVSSRHYFEAKMQDDPAWRERHRSKAREAYHVKKQAQAQQAQVDERERFVTPLPRGWACHGQAHPRGKGVTKRQVVQELYVYCTILVQLLYN